MTTKLNSEANYEIASQWWPDLRDIWTPIGWKDNLFRFNVLWNGTVIAEPCYWVPNINPRTTQWQGQGVQATIVPEYLEKPWSHERYSYLERDDARVSQDWDDCDAPVLGSQSMVDGLLLRQEVFAHIPEAKAVETGIEPLFMWIRLSVRKICEPLSVEKTCRFFIKLNAPHMYAGMSPGTHRFEIEKSEYPRQLRAESKEYSMENGFRILEQGNKVRIAVAPGQDCEVEFLRQHPKECDNTMHITLPTKPGSSVDILLPMLPTNRAVFDKELAFGYDASLKQANQFWAPKPQTAAVVDTPETAINETLAHSLKFQEVIAEKNPATGDYAFLCGSLRYAGMYATPNAMAFTMLEDMLGYHELVDKHIEILRKNQGTVVPPGDCFEIHPGYLSNPRELLDCIDWLSDHGAILYSVCMHAMLSGDQSFIDRWTDGIIKACEFIQHARSIAGHGGVEGVMPAAVASDFGTTIQGVWNDGWVYKGLTTAVRLLKRLEHPRAAEFARDAEDYKMVYQKAFRAKAAEMSTWKDRNGKQHPLVPTALSGEEPKEYRCAFYLDTGPLFLVFAGLFNADDPLMKSALLWFREGPHTETYRQGAAIGLISSLHHEMSSCEPCYSWNLFHSHQSADREKYIEGMYSLFAGGISRQTYTSCEARGGITGTLFTVSLASYLARLAVIDDEIKDDELHLLRLVPKAWLCSDRETVFEQDANRIRTGFVTVPSLAGRQDAESQLQA